MSELPDTRDLDRTGLAGLVIANNSEFLPAMGAAAPVVPAPEGVRWTINGSPIAYHNAVVEARLRSEEADGVIDDFAGRLRSARLYRSLGFTDVTSVEVYEYRGRTDEVPTG